VGVGIEGRPRRVSKGLSVDYGEWWTAEGLRAPALIILHDCPHSPTTPAGAACVLARRQAYRALDGTFFQGRLLHILPAQRREGGGGGDEAEGTAPVKGGGAGAVGPKSFKKERQRLLKARSMADVSWNALFVRVCGPMEEGGGIQEWSAARGRAARRSGARCDGDENEGVRVEWRGEAGGTRI